LGQVVNPDIAIGRSTRIEDFDSEFPAVWGEAGAEIASGLSDLPEDFPIPVPPSQF
jgi:hypothetical protein